MRNYALLVGVALIVLFVAGCGGTKENAATTPFVGGGTTGMLISFVEDTPPKEVYDGGVLPFDVAVKLKNDGEWDTSADDVLVKISGVSPQEFSLNPSDLVKHPDDDLEGTHRAEDEVNEGTTTYVTFEKFNYKGSVSGNLQFPIRADVCYKYGTRVSSMICVKKDLTDTSEKSLCVVSEDKPVFSSRAPIQVTSMKEMVRGKEAVGFSFKVEHKGNGQIFQKDTHCDSKGIAFENKVWVEVDTGMDGAKCTGLAGGTDTTGYITLYSGDRTVTCSQPAATETDYQKEVKITLVYDYQEDTTTQILLKHTVG